MCDLEIFYRSQNFKKKDGMESVVTKEPAPIGKVMDRKAQKMPPAPKVGMSNKKADSNSAGNTMAAKKAMLAGLFG